MKNFFKSFAKLTIVGISTGLMVALYKYITHFAINASKDIFFQQDTLNRTMAIIFGIILIFFAYFLLREDENIRGSGLVQLEYNGIKHHRKFNWIIELPMMFINSSISLFLGMPVGTEAPSAFIGGTIGLGLNNIYRDDNPDDVNISEGAGFAAAFLTPVAGITYSFEEFLHKFNLINLIKTIYVSSLAYITSYIANSERLLIYNVPDSFDFRFIYVFIFLIAFNIIIGSLLLVGVPLIRKFIYKHQNNLLIKYRYFIFAFLTFAIYLSVPILGGSGLGIIKSLDNRPLWYFILGLLIYRIVMFLFTSNSMASGGLLLPVLAIGAMNGYLSCVIGTSIGGFDFDHYGIVILIGMVSLFALTNKAPLTATILAMALTAGTHSITIIMPIALVVSFICYIPAKILKIDDILASRVKLMKHSKNK